MQGFFNPNDRSMRLGDKKVSDVSSSETAELRGRAERRKRGRRASDAKRETCLPDPILSEAEIALLLRGGR